MLKQGMNLAVPNWYEPASFDYNPSPRNAARTEMHSGPRQLSADEFTSVGMSGKRWPRQNNTKKKKGCDIEQEISGQNLYKTELCCSFESTGSCRYGVKCQFAHGKAELRPVLRHPKYKTEICKTYSATGSCPYGKRCRFIHTPQSHGRAQRQASAPVYGYTQGGYVPAEQQHARPHGSAAPASQWSVEWPQNAPGQGLAPAQSAPGLSMSQPVGTFAPEVDAYGYPVMGGAQPPVYAQHQGHPGDESYHYAPHGMGLPGVHLQHGYDPTVYADGTQGAPAAHATPAAVTPPVDEAQLSSLFANRLSLTDPQPSGHAPASPSVHPTAGSPEDPDNNRLSIFAKFSF